MMTQQSNLSQKAKVRNIAFLVGVTLLIGIGWYIASGTDFFDSSARVINVRSQPTSTDRDCERATIVKTRYGGSGTVPKNMDDLVSTFNLTTCQDANGTLHVRIRVPTIANERAHFEPFWFQATVTPTA